MEYRDLVREDFAAFRELATGYYRDGEDANTPQEELDFFIGILFEKVMSQEIRGCLVRSEGVPVGFALWAVDSEDFDFSEMPGLGTILEIGLVSSYRSKGHGKALVAYLEDRLRQACVDACYVTAYGPAQSFWSACGYVKNGRKASNGLPVMVKTL